MPILSGYWTVTGGGRRSRGRSLGWVLLLTVLAIAGGLTVTGSARASEAAAPHGDSGVPTIATIADNGVAQVTLAGGLVSTMVDRVTDGSNLPNERSYQVALTVSLPARLLRVNLTTNPVGDWSFPDQLPGGPDFLPPLFEWNWHVVVGSSDDTPNWMVGAQNGLLSRSAPWTNTTYLVVGTISPNVQVTVNPNATLTSHTPAIGYSLNGVSPNGPIPLSDPDYPALARPLGPELIRFGVVSLGMAIDWNNATGRPSFDFTTFDATVNYIANSSAQALLSVPVGTWGDGNFLPVGMPVDRSLVVSGAASSGYLPTQPAYASYVGGIVNHTAALGETIRYWSIGNEMPLDNATVTAAYIALFNVAQATIHATWPNALVGSDVMTRRAYIDQFAGEAKGVGFLSYHYYPATTVCYHNGNYCPPGAYGQGTTDAEIWNASDQSTTSIFLAPHLAQVTWHNLTGRWLPILDTESNLNAAVQGPPAGTDPRQQSLFGAAWLTTALATGARENVSVFNYFSYATYGGASLGASGPWGGFGFGMTSEGTADNDTTYAPYWALVLWEQNFPAGSRGLATTSSVPALVTTYAARAPGGFSLAVVNRVAISVSYAVSVVAPQYLPTRSQTLDSRSYVESYVASAGGETVLQSGTLTNDSTYGGGVVRFTLHGYGVGVVDYRYVPPTGGSGNNSTSPPPGGNSSGGSPPGTGSTSPPAGPAGHGAVYVPIHGRWSGISGVPGIPSTTPAVGVASLGRIWTLAYVSGIGVVAGSLMFLGVTAGGSLPGEPPRRRLR